jgi:hypothetical protein
VGQERLQAGVDEGSLNADLNELIKREAGILITAGTENQPANAHQKWKGSLLNKAVLDGLQGKADNLPKDGVITSRELYLYVRSFVSHQSRHPSTGCCGSSNRGIFSFWPRAVNLHHPNPLICRFPAKRWVQTRPMTRMK